MVTTAGQGYGHQNRTGIWSPEQGRNVDTGLAGAEKGLAIGVDTRLGGIALSMYTGLEQGHRTVEE